MNRSVRFINHACHTVETTDAYVLVDPWFSGTVFNDSWALLQDTSLDHIDFDRLTHVIISHEHPDHLHFPSLAQIKKLAQNDILVLMPRRNNPNVQQQIIKMGFSFGYLDPHATYQIGKDISITQFPAGMDAALVFRVGDKILLNQNDCKLSNEESFLLKRMFPKIDAWMMQFSLAGYYGNRDDHEMLRAKGQEGHLKLIEKYYSIFSPNLYVPFASFVYFCKQYNQYLNDWIVTPHMVHERFGSIPMCLPSYGEEIKWDVDDNALADSLSKYLSIFEGEKEIIPSPEVGPEELTQVAETFFKTLSHGGPSTTHLIIKDTPWNVSIDIAKREFGIIEDVDVSLVAGSLPAAELLCLLKFPWGADTLNISATHDIIDREKWYGLCSFIGELYKR